MIKEVKNARILEILQNTEKLLEEIESKVQIEISDIYDKGDLKTENKICSESNSQKTLNNANAEEKKPTSVGLFTRANTEKVTQPSCLVGGTLMNYQLVGLEFLVNLYNNNLSCILADEMGLGKTIQTISLLAYLYEHKNNKGPHLIAVPLSTLSNWMQEFSTWCPILKVILYSGSKEDRKILNQELTYSKFNVIITTFEYILRERKNLAKIKWRYIIIDEGHKMKNYKSKFHSTLAEFKSTHRILLTGTPLQNNLSELWSLLNFLMPKTFNCSEDFEKWFEEPFKDQYENKNDVAMNEEEKMVIINRLHLVLRPFILRRVKADVLNDLPSKREYIVRICLTQYQEFLYNRLVNKCLNISDNKQQKVCRSISNGVMQLRKVVNHPYLFVTQYAIDKNILRSSGKIETLDRMLSKLLITNHKILIFNQMTCVMDILSDYFIYRNYKFHRLDGTMSMTERQERINEYNDPNSKINIFMLSTRAGGLGLNLQIADTVILFDSDWNPHVDLQAQARAHRVGQKREVRVYRFVTLSPVEELILSKAEYKLNLDEQIIQAGMFSTKYSEQERSEKLRYQGLPKRLISKQRLNNTVDL
ncbi:uncharacterized protein LOC142598010 [Dermatophagoides farinae]|uniref:uncharacterized protein LOC142598010 n=1 Tax=Dermatophagoides farinae TaxID=6954 RepID=UPI003F62B432